MGDYDDGKVLRYLFSRAKKIGFDLQLGRDGDNNNPTIIILILQQILGSEEGFVLAVAIEKQHILMSLALQD